ncbi:MAG: hypothetical protein C6Y22_26420 [Hapalosiphonaceae cyanobacterium JJU2]|nr:MAG: hypothetical protein C6Y22_26420 [Hapalosiphonaceae cyanobacterium JJU2]
MRSHLFGVIVGSAIAFGIIGLKRAIALLGKFWGWRSRNEFIGVGLRVGSRFSLRGLFGCAIAFTWFGLRVRSPLFGWFGGAIAFLRELWGWRSRNEVMGIGLGVRSRLF